MPTSAAVEAVFEPVTQPTAVDETIERLGTAIRLGLLPPGRRLPPERDLADQFQIARSTLRQALTALVQSGHLVAARGRGGGTFVADEPPLVAGSAVPSLDQVRAVLDFRVAIEVGAVMLAAERVRPEDLARLEELVDAMAGAGCFADYRRADIHFHLALAEAARSPRLLTAMTEVQGDMSELIGLIPHPEAVLTRSNAQHRRLVNVLHRGDGASAARLLREHLAGTEHVVIGLLPRSDSEPAAAAPVASGTAAD